MPGQLPANQNGVTDLKAPTSVAAGPTFEVKKADQGRLRRLKGTVYASGTFVATVRIEVTADGTTWVQARFNGTLVADITAGIEAEIEESCLAVRARTTAFTSGTPLILLVSEVPVFQQEAP